MTAPELIANRYRVERELGAGAMGRVMLVQDTTSDQTVALKVVLGDRAELGGSTVAQLPGGSQPVEGTSAAKSLLQFKQEFRLMTQLHHPNCCQVYDYGQMPDGAPYFTMEVVPGCGLDELLPLPAERFVPLFSQLLLALGYIHQLGFVHCDLKSANVRVRPDGTIKLMDYGLMEFAGRPAASIRGTLPYLAPEMIKRGPIDQRSDLYSLGCLAYEMLAGRLPFVTERPMDVLRAHVMEAPPPLARFKPEVDPVMAEVVMKLLAKEPMDRFQSAGEVLEALGCEPPAGIGGNLLASPLMGREAEMYRLGALLDAAVKHRPGATLAIWGPSGIGKSRLVEEFRFMVQLEGLPYVVGTCHDHRRDPFGPFISIFHQLIPVARELAPDVLAAEAPVLVKVLPELAASVPGVVPAAALDTGKQEFLRLQSSMTALLKAIATHTGVVIVLEDWHWADAGSIELLQAVQRTRQEAPVLVVVTTRHDPKDGSSLDSALSMPLGSLSVEGLRRLVSNMLGTEHIEVAFLEQLAALTEGNPFFVERLLEHLVKQGLLQRDRGRWDTAIRLDERLPSSLQTLLLEKLEALGDDARRLACVLAVLGRPAPLALLGHGSGLGEDQLIAAAHELGRAKLVQVDARGNYHFAQVQFAATLYGHLPPAARANLHALMFDALHREVADLPMAEIGTERVTELARHGLKGRQPERAIAYTLEAGERHARLYSLAEADRLLTTGLELVDAHLPIARRVERFAFLRTLGEVKRQSGQAADAAMLLQRALTTALDRDRLSGPLCVPGTSEPLVEPAQVGRLLTSLAKACQVQGQYDKAIEHATRAIDICTEAADSSGAARASLTIARVRFYQGKGLDAVADAERALALAREGRDKGVTGLAHAFLGYLYVSTQPDKLGIGIQNLHASLVLLLQAGDRPGLNDSYNLLGNAENMLGNFKGASQAFKESRKVCLEIGFREDEAVAMVNLATTAIELGDWPVALQHAREARALAESLGARLPWGMALALEATALAQLGPLADAAALAEQAVAMARSMSNKYLESLVLMQQVETLLALGRLAPAREAADALEQLIAETGNQECAGRLEAARAELHARQGLYGTAREHADRALAAAKEAGAKGQEVQALRIIARMHALAERWDEARTSAQTALALAERLGCQAQRADILGVLGEASLVAGDGQATGHFAAMGEAAGQTGVPTLIARAHFGQAAADPEAPEAEELSRRARDLVQALAAPLDEATRTEFLAFRERRRLMDGDYRGFGAPARKAAAAPPLGIRFGGTGL